MSIYDKKTVRDIDVEGKRVLVRVDFNVPLTPDCKIADDTRIRESLPTVRYLVERGAKVILISHLGRPKGKMDPRYSMKVCANRFAQLLDAEVRFCPDCIGELPETKIKKLKNGDVIVLENLRFYPGEEANDEEFAQALAAHADIFVNDAFGAAHRAHASTEGVTHFLPSVAGLLVEKELVVMGKALTEPEHPFVAIMGGAKVSDKIGVVQNLLGKVDYLLTGGGVAHTFLAAKGYDVAQSIMSPEHLDWAKELLATDAADKLILPVDLVVADSFNENARKKVVPVDQIPAGWMGLDVGPETIKLYDEYLKKAKTIVWNGPMGVFEMEPFAVGTKELALRVAKSRATSIIGGGDSVAAVEKVGVSFLVSHISTGGGSTLEFLEGKELPALAALDDLDDK